VILDTAVLIQCQGVSDGLRNGRTDGQTSWPAESRRAKHFAIARKKAYLAYSRCYRFTKNVLWN